jgi:acetoacetyl-CoA synthetase
MQAMWTPRKTDIEQSNLDRFQRQVEEKYLQKFPDYQSFHQFSVQKKDIFWRELIQFFDIEYRGELGPENIDDSFKSYGWFPRLKINFAENLLSKGRANSTALHFFHESGAEAKISYAELAESAQALQEEIKENFSKGDVLACFMPNIPETVISMLATSGLGGVFTSTSCDFGIEGVVDRFGQSRPKILVAAAAYQYNGKTIDLLEKIEQIKQSVPSIEKVIIVDFLATSPKHSFTRWEDIQALEKKSPVFVEMNFSDPLYIMYSSGTTGKPKCIVHSVGGTLLQHVKEHGLHGNMKEEKSVFFFTTCGWMMWNWLVSGLFFGGKIVLYEGSPGHPSLSEYLDIINRAEINFFGTSPKFLRALEDSGAEIPGPFPSLESVMSTGAPLLSEQYDFIHDKIKKVHIASISGGTDIIGCFMLGNSNLPVVRGEIQCLGLGMDVDAWNSEGESVIDTQGELVCKSSFPSRPLCFLNDEKGERINSAYFNHFAGVWYHGDFITLTDRGSVVVHGRSDATLNPGGVRIGTAEIYRQTELISYLDDSICVGKMVDGDVQVILFVKMSLGQELTNERCEEIKRAIKCGSTPRHVPKEIIAVGDIPYTRSGKKMELAVTRLIAGKTLSNIEAVANPECLTFFS